MSPAVKESKQRPKLLTLEDYTDEMLALDDLAAMDDGEWTMEHEQLATELLAKLAEKTDNLVKYRETMRMQEAMAKAYASETNKRAKRWGERVQWLDDYVLAQLARSGRERLQGDVHALRRQANTPSVQIDVLPSQLPEAFVRIIPEQREADKVAILAALKAGETIPGASIAPVSYHLRVA